MDLVSPSLTYKNSYLQALQESKGETHATRLEFPTASEEFAEFVSRLNNYAKGLQLPEGWIPSTELWLVDEGEFIGRVSIRHTLTEYLRKEGGHIGYYIRFSKRRMGYGKKILALALLEAKKLGLKKVLITCDDNNIGSKKIIEANGGVLENKVEVEGKPAKCRYWIEIPS